MCRMAFAERRICWEGPCTRKHASILKKLQRVETCMEILIQEAHTEISWTSGLPETSVACTVWLCAFTQVMPEAHSIRWSGLYTVIWIKFSLAVASGDVLSSLSTTWIILCWHGAAISLILHMADHQNQGLAYKIRNTKSPWALRISPYFS